MKSLPFIDFTEWIQIDLIHAFYNINKLNKDRLWGSRGSAEFCAKIKGIKKPSSAD